MIETCFSREDAHELILAEWRSQYPLSAAGLQTALPIFVEQVLASPLGAFSPDGESRRETIQRWIRECEAERRCARQAQSQGATM